MKNGWIRIYRKVTDNPLYFSEKFTRMQAWFDLLILANHDKGFIYVRGNKVDVKRGEIGMSRENIGRRWKWSRGKVDRFLNELENEGMLIQQKNNITSLISICNYNAYQGDDTTDEHQIEQQKRQQTVQQTCNRQSTNKNDKNDKNIKNTKKVDFDLSFIQENFKDLVIDFIDYRKQIKKAWKTEQAIKAFHNKLLKLSGGDFEKAKRLIEHAKNNEWQTVYEIKEEKKHDTNRRNFERTDHAAETL